MGLILTCITFALLLRDDRLGVVIDQYIRARLTGTIILTKGDTKGETHRHVNHCAIKFCAVQRRCNYVTSVRV